MATRKLRDGFEMSKLHCHTFIKSSTDTLKTVSSNPHSKDILYGIIFIVVLLCAARSHLQQRQRRRSALSRPSTPTTLEKAQPSKFAQPTRKPGTWEPSPFRMPTPPAYPDWSIETTKPLPYRPFRYGPKYNVTMGLRNTKHVDWIELDNHFPKYHADKSHRIATRGARCGRTAPEALPAALELLEDLTHYLPSRYPTLYARTPTGLKNLWSNESFDTLVPDIFTATSSPSGEDPIQTAARLVQDDLAIMIERPDGQYYLLSGAIHLAGFWRLEDKFGMCLSEIHTSGDVPEYKQKLEKGMMSFFRRLKPEEMVARNNYFIQVDDELAWSRSIGPEDAESEIGWKTADKNRAIEHHWFRSERQTLRRLPRSGGVVFTIRTYFHPIVDVCREEYVPGRLASALRSWGDDVSRYKGKEKYENVLLEYLDRKHEEQVEAGLDLGREDEVRAYPY